MNYDVSFLGIGNTSVGIIARDEKGQVLLATLKQFLMTYDIPMGESTIVLICKKLALDVGFANLNVETDNIQVSYAL